MNFFVPKKPLLPDGGQIACLQELRTGIDLSAERFDLPSLSDGGQTVAPTMIFRL
jgi:hypothetical protein